MAKIDLERGRSGKPRETKLPLKTGKLATYAVFFLLALALLFGVSFAVYLAAPASAWKSLDISGSYIWLPDIVGEFFNGKIVNLHFRMANGETLDVCGTAYPKEKQPPALRPAGIFKLSWQVCSDWDYDVSMSDANALSLATSTTPIRTFASLMDKGEIRVKPNGQENAIRFQYAYNEFRQMDGQGVPPDIRAIFEKYREYDSG